MARLTSTIPKPPPLHGLTPLELVMARSTPMMFALAASQKKFQTPPHIQLLDDKLYQLAHGHIKRLMVFMPPRHGKSLLCSQYFPAWYIGEFKRRVILTSYGAMFAASWGRLARNVLTEWGPVIWPDVRVAQDSAAADHWELEGAESQYGVMYTAGIEGGTTGKGASLLIVDDPVKNMEEAKSPVMREKAWDFYTSTAYTRLEPDASILVIQTRWHSDDLSGRILQERASGEGEPWHVLSLPAIAEADEYYEIAGCEPFERHEGDALWPERFSAERLATIRADVGGSVWSALYQQHPTPDGGLIWHREWFNNRYRELPTMTKVVQSIDTAFKTGVASDFSVIATWGRTDTDFYLIDLWRARVEYPELKRAILEQAHKHNPERIYVEDAASGQSAFQELKRESDLPIFRVPPEGSKEARAAGVSPLAEAGKVWLPESGPDTPWLADWIEEHVNFPRGAHDDCVDTTSLALTRLKRISVWG
jgi:predicted phage terminase large subunit-like protein